MKIHVSIYLSISSFFSLGKPSRVIHIRNIPNDSSESEVIQLGLPFGRVTNILVLKGKNQAFLEMLDEACAAAMVACFNTNPPQVRGRTVYVQFSNHRELKIDQSHSVIVSKSLFFSLEFTIPFFLTPPDNDNKYRQHKCKHEYKTPKISVQCGKASLFVRIGEREKLVLFFVCDHLYILKAKSF